MQESTSSSENIQCSQCKKPFESADRLASISGSILGDEYTDSFFLCPACGIYTIASWRDNFTGIETFSASGPVTKSEGDSRVELIRKCDCPWDKKCRCDAHRVYFGGALD